MLGSRGRGWVARGPDQFTFLKFIHCIVKLPKLYASDPHLLPQQPDISLRPSPHPPWKMFLIRACMTVLCNLLQSRTNDNNNHKHWFYRLFFCYLKNKNKHPLTKVHLRLGSWWHRRPTMYQSSIVISVKKNGIS